MTYAIIAVVLVVALILLMVSRHKSDKTSQDTVEQSQAEANAAHIASPEPISPEPMSPMPQPTVQPTESQPSATQPVQVAAPAAATEAVYAPPRTSRLDDDGLEAAPALAPGAFDAARAGIGQEVPDDVLGEMLLDTTPEQAQQMFARVSPETLQVVTSTQAGMQLEGEASDDDWAALDGLGSAIDDLDIWDFGEADFGEGDRVVH